MIRLFDDQEATLDKLRGALKVSKRILLVASTGFGKTAVATIIAKGVFERGKRLTFVCHRKELIKQTCKTFDKVGIDYGVIAPGYKKQPEKLIQIASVFALIRRMDMYEDPDVLLIDEAHHSTAGSWKKVIDRYQCMRIGLSATPIRRDGSGLDEFYSDIVLGPSISWLIENGRLSKYEAYAPYIPDLSSARIQAGDYRPEDLDSILTNNQIIKNVVDAYSKYGGGQKAIIFATSVNHSKQIISAFQAAGYSAEHVDGDTPDDERERITSSFASGDITIMSNVGLFGEGYDVPDAVVLIDCAPTLSLGKCMQQWGRVLRVVYAGDFDLYTREGRLSAIDASHKKSAIILDCAGNFGRHGFPDDDREWDLKGRKKRRLTEEERAIPVKICPCCYHVHQPAAKCPKCGHEYVTNGRDINEVDGDLVRISPEEFRRLKSVETSKAKTLDELKALGKARGYSPKWAHMKYKFKVEKRKKFEKRH